VLRFLRSFLLSFALIAVPLGVLAGAGVSVALRQLAEARAAATERTLSTVTAVVADGLDGLRREAVLLARDPSIVEGAVKGDWATLARGGSPRILAVTREGFADLVVVRDARGAPLVQVPAVPPPPVPALALANEPLVTVRALNGRPYLLAAAPIFPNASQEAAERVPVGTVVVARRFESLGRMIERVPSRPSILFMAGDRMLGTTRADTPAQGWTAAVAAGQVTIGGEPYTLQPLGGAPSSPDGSLWALVSDSDFRHAQRQLWLGLGVLVGVAALILAVGIAVLIRWGGGRRARAAEKSEGWRQALERRNRELEALNAIAVTIGRSADLVTTAEETLDVVRSVARMDVGVVYRFDAGAGELVLLAQRGLTAEQEARTRVRPLDGTHVGEAARSGHTQVAHLDVTPPTEPVMREIAVAREHQTQLALPIPVKDQTWGVMALISQAKRDFSSEDLAVLEAVAHYVGVAVERAQLREMAEARLKRLEAQRQIERHISEQLDVEELLVLVAGAALRLIGGTFSVVYLREGDELRPRAWSGVGSWIRQVRIRVGSGVAGTAAETGGGLIVNDYPNSPLTLPPFSNVTQRLMAQPLMAGDRALGVMVISRDRASPPFVEEDQATLADFTTQAVVALEKARLFSEARRSAAEYQALFEVGALVSSVLDVDRVLDLIVDRCHALLGVAGAGVFRLDAAEGYLLYERGIGLSPEFLRAVRIGIGEGTTGKAVQERIPVWSEDLLSDTSITLSEETRAQVEREGYRSVLSVPIITRGEVQGVLAVYWWEPRRPSPSEVSLLTALAGQAGVALENARLYGAATARGKRLSTLGRLTETLTATLSLEDVLSRVVHSAVELFGSSVARLWLMDDDGQAVSLRAHAGATAPLVGVTRLGLGEGLMGRIVASRAPLVVPDLRAERSVRNRERIAAEGTVSFAGVPLILGDRVLGALSVALREAHTFAEEDLDLLQSLASHAAIAIENARLFDEERTSREHLAALLELNKKIGALAPTDTLLTSIAEEAARLLNLDNAGFRLLDGDELVVAGLAGTARQTMLRSRIKIGQSLSGKAVQERRAIICALEGSAMIAEHLAADRRLGYTTFLGVPLRVGERIIGVLSFRARRPLTEADQQIAEAFADQAAIALDHARFYREAALQADRMRAVAELGRTLVSTFDIDRILETAIARARDTLDVSHVSVCLADPETGLLRFVRDAAFPDEVDQNHVIEPGEGVAGRAVAEGRPVWTPNILTDAQIRLRPETRRRIEQVGTRAVLALPLMREQPFGALVVQREPGHRFGDLEIEYLTAFANQVAVALENARLYEALEVRASRLRALARLTHIVSSSLDMDEVLGTIARAAAELTGVPLAVFWVANEGARTLEVRAVSDERMAADFPNRTLHYDQGATGVVAVRRELVNIPDLAADERYLSQEWAAGHGLRSFFGVPILFQDSLLGVLTLNGRKPLRLGHDDLQLLDSFIAQASVAIRNARLYTDTSRRLAETRALLELAEILNSTLEPGRLLKQVAIKIAQLCHVDRCTIERWDGDRVIPLMSQFADGRRMPEMWKAFREMRTYAPREVPAHIQAIESRRPVVIPDTAETDLIPREWIDVFSLKSYMVVPLIQQDAVIGVLNLDYAERAAPFEPWQQDLAMAIAGQLALSLENTRLYGEVRERLRETTILLAVGQALSRPGSPAEMMRGVARQVAHAFGADTVGVYELDELRENLVPRAGYRVPKHLLHLFLERPLALRRFPLLAQAWREGRAIWSKNAVTDPRFDSKVFEGLEPHSVLLAPTAVRGEAVGALMLVWWGAGKEFSQAEVRLVEGVAAQVGLATENAELARQTQRKLHETETLLSVSQTLSSTLDLEMLPRHLLRHVVHALGSDSAGIWLLGEDGEWMAPFVGYHVPPDKLERLRQLRLSIVQHPFYAEAARTRQSVISTDAMNDPRIPQEIREAVGQRTHLFVPIIAKDRMIGGFATTWWDRARPLSEDEQRLMEAIASQAGVALENARLFRDNQRRVEELSVLHELSQAITGQLDQAGLIETVHRQVARVLDVSHMVVLLQNEVEERLEVALRVRAGVRRDEEPPHSYPNRAAGLAGIVFDTGRAIRTDDYTGECARREVAPVPGSEGLKHWLGVPMAVGDQRLGVLALRGRDRAFSDADERMLSNIAHLAALALRSARLYEERARAFAEVAAAQDQLVRTEKLRALGEMASGVAHDFNNVLASILGRAQLLLDKVEDPKLRQWLQVIERAATDGARTVRRLQDFTRIRRDQPAVAVDLNQVIQQVLEATESTWQQQARSRGITIEVTTALAIPLPRITGDPAELREALTNLILNAVDAMPRGGRLTLTTRDAEGHVEVTVSDTGIGIPEAIRQKIFDPFFTTKGPRGTGLGLSMTYGILSRHGARVTVESEEGQGTTFRLVFPAAEQVGEMAPAPKAPTRSSVLLRCLVVDDEAVVGEVLGDMLISAGHEAVVVASGQAAVARFKARPFDIVFTDLAMPGMTGWEVARAIKDLAPAIPVVLVSGFGVEVSAADLRANGVDLVLAKPLKIPDVLGAMSTLRVQGRAQRGEKSS
jgi:GAF domain-containing protein/ActR/RegA family two-component response regulator/anti-sigma regulatory factor (Ser/Thr protein kinase)